MIFKDDRTAEQKLTHTIIVLATDKFLSGWGEAKGGPSYAGWACKPELQFKIFERVSERSEMRRVRVVTSNYHPPSGPGHCHIYVADD